MSVRTATQVWPPPDNVTSFGVVGATVEFVTTARHSRFAVGVTVPADVNETASVALPSASRLTAVIVIYRLYRS